MKKIICFSIVLLALFATSCQKDVNPPEDVASDSFVASISEGSARNIPPADGNRSMTTIENARDVYWTIGDGISVNGAIYTLQRDTTISGDPNCGVFTNSERTDRPEKEDGLWKAVYPASAGYTLPATQDGSFKNVPMYAQSENEYLKFDIITAVLKIVVPAEANGAKLITLSSTDKALSGTFTIADAGTNPCAEVTGTSGVKLTGPFSAGQTVYVPIPAGRYSDLNIKFYTNNENDDEPLLSKSMTFVTTFKVNKLYTFNINMDDFFYFEAKQAGSTVIFNGNGTLEYSSDKSDWSNYANSEEITLTNVGDRVYFRATKANEVIGRETIPSFELEGNLKVGGNIMYLLNETANDKDFSSKDSQFQYLFYGQTALTDASDLKLPSRTLTAYCFADMFDYCTGLTSAPALPSTDLASYCYSEMFFGCSALTAAPELPATTMLEGCYYSMFNGCSALTAAPALPATTLAQNCYALMFMNCTSLVAAPELPATTLQVSCYSTMFNGCSNLSSVTMKATDVSAEYCMNGWLYDAGTNATSRTLKVASGMTTNSIITANTPNNWTIIEYTNE